MMPPVRFDVQITPGVQRYNCGPGQIRTWRNCIFTVILNYPLPTWFRQGTFCKVVIRLHIPPPFRIGRRSCFKRFEKRLEAYEEVLQDLGDFTLSIS